jgi:6-phosphogluconolactonase/glucosamine-6-phosphate isomerase/deaminase
VDERAVPPNHEQSNYRLAEECLIRPAKIRNVHRIPAELTPKQAAKRYSTDIREHFQVNEGELPHFDVVHLGIGPDAHTASLFPGEPLIDDRQGLAAAVYVEKIPQWRITLLPGVLLAARNMVILAAGADKKEPLDHILKGPYDPLLYPAQIVARQARRPIFFLDEAAG